MEEKDISLGRREILEQAALCVCQDREQQYSSPENSFAKIADLWNAYKPCDFTPHDVGIMMALLKIARISTGAYKDDNYIDLAGYAACAGEIALNKPAEARKIMDEWEAEHGMDKR